MKKSDKAIQEVTRHIKAGVERELWGRAAARCQFSDCNRLLYKSPVTQESVNLAEMAHISFSKAGSRSNSLRLRLPQHSCNDHTKLAHAPSQNRN